MLVHLLIHVGTYKGGAFIPPFNYNLMNICFVKNVNIFRYISMIFYIKWRYKAMKKGIRIVAVICGIIAVFVLFSAGKDLLIANGIISAPERKNELDVTNKYFLGSIPGYTIFLRFDDEGIVHISQTDIISRKIVGTGLGSYSQDNRKVYITTTTESVYILSEDGKELVCGSEKYRIVEKENISQEDIDALE